jgi:hypothetical protein
LLTTPTMRNDVRLPELIITIALCACGGHGQKVREPMPATEARPVPPRVMTAEDSNYRLRHGLPAGYLGVADEGQDIKDATYRQSEGRWIITTGPAHIMYSPADTLTGVFTVASTFDQMEAPTHPEAFGLFVGGADLDKPTLSYTYFVVRGTGEFLVRVREGSSSRDVIGWTASPAIVKQGAGGQARYRLAIQVRGDSVRFMVGGKPVAAIKSGSVPTNGIAGLRINHNLKLKADLLRAG